MKTIMTFVRNFFLRNRNIIEEMNKLNAAWEKYNTCTADGWSGLKMPAPYVTMKYLNIGLFESTTEAANYFSKLLGVYVAPEEVSVKSFSQTSKFLEDDCIDFGSDVCFVCGSYIIHFKKDGFLTKQAIFGKLAENMTLCFYTHPLFKLTGRKNIGVKGAHMVVCIELELINGRFEGKCLESRRRDRSTINERLNNYYGKWKTTKDITLSEAFPYSQLEKKLEFIFQESMM